MKTKTIEVWVNNEDIETMTDVPIFENRDEYLKATLTYEVEEPKKSFTESEVRDAIMYAHKNGMAIHAVCDRSIKKLFGESDEQ